jgi:hypothetical protein
VENGYLMACNSQDEEYFRKYYSKRGFLGSGSILMVKNRSTHMIIV